MRKNSILKAGDKVELTFDGVRFYTSMVGEVYENGLVLVAVPISKRVPMTLYMYDEVYLVLYRDTGKYSMQMRAAGFETKDGIKYAVLEQLSDTEKKQRREFYRLPVHVEVLMCEYKEGDEFTLEARHDIDAAVMSKAKTKNVSATGIALEVPRLEGREGDKYVVKMFFDGFHSKKQPFVACAEVIRVEPAVKHGAFNMGMRFFGLNKWQNEFLSHYIMAQQKKMIRQKRLLEGR